MCFHSVIDIVLTDDVIVEYVIAQDVWANIILFLRIVPPENECTNNFGTVWKGIYHLRLDVNETLIYHSLSLAQVSYSKSYHC